MSKRTFRQSLRNFVVVSHTERPSRVSIAFTCVGFGSGFVLMGMAFRHFPPDWVLLAVGALQLLVWLPTLVGDVRAYRHLPPNPMHELQRKIKAACLTLLADSSEVVATSDSSGYLLSAGTRRRFWKYLLISQIAKSDIDEVFLSADREGFVLNRVYALITRPEFSANVLEVVHPQRVKDTEDGPIFLAQPKSPKLTTWQTGKMLRSGAMYATREDLEVLLADLTSARPFEPD